MHQPGWPSPRRYRRWRRRYWARPALGSCDPCPGPTLDGNDLATFGADVLAATYTDTSFWSMTLTRLHARYGTEVSDDLVFRAVEPLEGGRGTPDAEGKIQGGARLSGGN